MNANEREYILTSRRESGSFFFMESSIFSERMDRTAYYKVAPLIPRREGQR